MIFGEDKKMKNKNFITPPMRKPTGETGKTVVKRKDSWFEVKLKDGEHLSFNYRCNTVEHVADLVILKECNQGKEEVLTIIPKDNILYIY